MRGCIQMALALALCCALSACAALDEWLAQPVAESPVGAPGEPVAVELPQGTGEVVYLPPPPAPEGPNNGELLGQTIGQVAGALTGNPAWGIVAGGALAALLGRRKAAPKPAPAPPAAE